MGDSVPYNEISLATYTVSADKACDKTRMKTTSFIHFYDLSTGEVRISLGACACPRAAGCAIDGRKPVQLLQTIEQFSSLTSKVRELCLEIVQYWAKSCGGKPWLLVPEVNTKGRNIASSGNYCAKWTTFAREIVEIETG